MKITQELTVARPAAVVWDFFQDVPEVAKCLPGAELLSSDGDGKYTGRVAVKLGPLSGTIDGKGTDRRGGSRGQVKVLYTLVPDGGGTRVTIDADVVLSGAAAQFG